MYGSRSWSKKAKKVVLIGTGMFLLLYGLTIAPFKALLLQKANIPMLEALASDSKSDSKESEHSTPTSSSSLWGKEETLMEDLHQQRALLMEKEKALQRKEEDLKALQAELEQKMAELTQLRKELKELLAQKDAQEEERILRIVKLYEAMRPAEAAPMLTTMKDEIAVDLLTRMNTKKAGKILALVPTKRANELTQKLAKRE